MFLSTYASSVLFLLLVLCLLHVSNTNILPINKKAKIKYGNRSYSNKKPFVERTYRLLFLNRNKNERTEKNKRNGNISIKDVINNFQLQKNEYVKSPLFRNYLKREDLFELIIPVEQTGTLAKCYIIDTARMKTSEIYENVPHTQKNIYIKSVDSLNIHKVHSNSESKKKNVINKKKKTKLIPELKKVAEKNEQIAKISKYINEQLIRIMKEIILLRKKREIEENEQREKKKNAVMEWDFDITTKEKPLNCFIYFDVPENTILLKPSEIKDTKYLISINALNDIRRNNQDILKNIYFKKYNITFDYIYKNCNFFTLLVNKLLDQPHILNVGTVVSLLSSVYISRNVVYQFFLQFLSSKIMWNYIVYNIWFNMYHTTLPFKLFLLKQAFSYANIGKDILCGFLKSRLIKLETFLLNASIKSKLNKEKALKNIYDKTKFRIATTTDIHADEMEENGDFSYV